jgi:hypothetical protein
MTADLTAAEVALKFKCTKRKITDEARRLGIGYNLGGRAGYRFTEADVESLRRALTPAPKVEGRRIA